MFRLEIYFLQNASEVVLLLLFPCLCTASLSLVGCGPAPRGLAGTGWGPGPGPGQLCMLLLGAGLFLVTFLQFLSTEGDAGEQLSPCNTHR